MFKKLAMAVLAVLALGIGVVAVKFVIPMVTVLDKAGPGSAPRDRALQDDSKVLAPYANADAELPPGQSIADAMTTGEAKLYWGELHLHTAESFDASMMGNKISIEDA